MAWLQLVSLMIMLLKLFFVFSFTFAVGVFDDDFAEILLCFQFHIRVLETAQENISALLVGLEYLINISYVDDTEVFKVS